jgi:phage shock protein PspC (stress-responsive transcriptional regulator)
MRKKLENISTIKRVPEKGIISGVSAGLAYYFGVSLWIVRLILVILLLGGWHFMPIAYILMWVFVPKAEHTPEDFDELTK